jgi:hypothetical protein
MCAIFPYCPFPKKITRNVSWCFWFTLLKKDNFCSLFYNDFSVIRLYDVDDRVTREWWWTDENWHPSLKRNSNPRSQRPSDQGLRLLQRGHCDLQEDIKKSLCITGATATFADDTAILAIYDRPDVATVRIRNNINNIQLWTKHRK